MYVPSPRTALNGSLPTSDPDLALVPPVYLLTRTWNVRMALGSYFIAILGAYTATQLVCSVSAHQRLREKLGWLALAAFSLGGTAVWGMHWVKMLAMKIGVPVRFNTPVALVSGACAVVGTFLTLAFDLLLEEYRRSARPALRRSGLGNSAQALVRSHGSDDSIPLLRRSSSQGREDTAVDATGTHTLRRRLSGTVKPLKPRALARPNKPLSLPKQPHSPALVRTESDDHDRDTPLSDSAPTSTSGTPSIQRPFDPLDIDSPPPQREVVAFPLEIEGSTSLEASPSFVAQVLCGMRSRTFVKGMLLGTTVLCMHYSAMYTMRMDAWFVWNPYLVLGSALLAWSTTVFVVWYIPTEPNAFRQAMVAVLGPTGISCMHFLGIASGAIYTTLPPPHNENDVSSDLPLLILSMAILTYVLAYALLTHLLTQSRNRLVETYTTKRQLWRAIAENEAFARANKAQSEFISVASHEIRTPLHAISGYTDLLLQTRLTEEQAAYLEAVRMGCRSIQLITNNVLDFSKLEQDSKESVAHPSEVKIRDLVQHVLQACAIPHRMSERALRRLVEYSEHSVDEVRVPTEKRVELLLLVEEDVPGTVCLDEVYVTRLLMNLISNALKFTDDGYVLVHVSLTPSPSPSPSPYLRISVKDTGIGIPSSAHTTIFEPFRQAATDSHRVHAGAGLGLAISRQLCERMGGTLGVRSEVGEGSEFVVQVPGGVAPSALSDDDDEDTPAPIKLGMAVGSARTAGVLRSLLEPRGFAVLPIDLAHTARALQPSLSQAERLWIDIECFSSAPWLLEHVLRGGEREGVGGLVLHDDVGSEAGRAVSRMLEGSGGLSLVRRPIGIHDLVARLRRDGRGGGKDRPRILRVPSLPTPGASPLTSPRTTAVRLTEGEGVGSGRVGLDTGVGLALNGAALLSPVSIPEASLAEKACILLVEDNPVNQELGVRMLRKLGYGCEVADNGKVALEMVRADREKYALVLMDCQMPIMSGFECTRQIRALESSLSAPGGHRYHLPIMALTANVSSESREQCRRAGADGFLAKPLLLVELGKAIGECLEGGGG